jgi:uncharacterized protein (TIGR03067 family)
MINAWQFTLVLALAPGEYLATCGPALAASIQRVEHGRVIREKLHGRSLEHNPVGESPDRWLSIYSLEHNAAATELTNGQESQAADLDQLQGEWQLESATRDGKEMPPEMRKLFKCRIQGNKFTITRDGKPVEQGTLKLEPMKKPKAIEFNLGEDKQALGIYDVSGDIYKQCYAPPGKDRPKDFSAKEGSGHTLSVWKRIRS